MLKLMEENQRLEEHLHAVIEKLEGGYVPKVKAKQNMENHLLRTNKTLQSQHRLQLQQHDLIADLRKSLDANQIDVGKQDECIRVIKKNKELERNYCMLKEALTQSDYNLKNQRVAAV